MQLDAVIMMSKYSFEEDVIMSKAELAKTQLEDAIDLFLSGKRISVITLAGAAEEIFSRLLNIKKENSASEETWENIELIRNKTGLPYAGVRTKSDAFREWNQFKNALKHHSGKDEDPIEFSPFDAAYEMINRANINADKLGIIARNRQEYESWLIENIYTSKI